MKDIKAVLEAVKKYLEDDNAEGIDYKMIVDAIASVQQPNTDKAKIYALELSNKHLSEQLAALSAQVDQPKHSFTLTWSWYDDKTGSLNASSVLPPFGGMQEGEEIDVIVHNEHGVIAYRGPACTPEVVTLESALNAIEHMEQYNGPGRKQEARALLTYSDTSKACEVAQEGGLSEEVFRRSVNAQFPSAPTPAGQTVQEPVAEIRLCAGSNPNELACIHFYGDDCLENYIGKKFYIAAPTVHAKELANVTEELRCMNLNYQALMAEHRKLKATRIVTDEQQSGQVYGIIDPDYGRIYTIIRKLAWEEGYAIGLHGSFTRDLDLIAVPWAERVCEPEHLIRRIVASPAQLRSLPSNPGTKPNGRLVWTLMLPEFGDPRFVDLSIMPQLSVENNQ